MNFLAHAYLSFDNKNLLVGNLIADLIRGRQIEAFPKAIQNGIELHRAIDSFTDNHPTVKETKLLFYESVGRYGGSFLDIAYDHFLALDSKYEPEIGWDKFAQHSYQQIESCTFLLPTQFYSMFEYMKNENWLYNYRYTWMIKKSFNRLSIRAKFLPDKTTAFKLFEKHYELLNSSYNIFFPQLREYSMSFINEKSF